MRNKLFKIKKFKPLVLKAKLLKLAANKNVVNFNITDTKTSNGTVLNGTFEFINGFKITIECSHAFNKMAIMDSDGTIRNFNCDDDVVFTNIKLVGAILC